MTKGQLEGQGSGSLELSRPKERAPPGRILFNGDAMGAWGICGGLPVPGPASFGPLCLTSLPQVWPDVVREAVRAQGWGHGEMEAATGRSKPGCRHCHCQICAESLQHTEPWPLCPEGAGFLPCSQGCCEVHQLMPRK